MSKSFIVANFFSFVLLAFILVIPGAGEASFAVLALWGMGYCYQNKINPFQFPQTKIISYLCVFYFFIALLSVCASTPSFYAFKRLSTNIHFLFAPFLAVFLFQQLKISILDYAIKIGAILAGIIAIIQFFYLGIRADGAINAILFGDLALLLAFFSILNFHTSSKKHKYISGVSFFLGLAAVILSLSRGAWIAIPIFCVLLLSIWYKQQFLLKKQLHQLCVASVIILIVISMTPQVQSRLKQLETDINLYSQNKNTSVGIRMNLWTAAVNVYPNHPILGYGLHDIKLAASDYFHGSEEKERFSSLRHFHNEYLNTLVAKGFLGFVSLIALLFIPLRLFFKRIKHSSDYYLAFIGFFTCTGYAIFGLTNLAFGQGLLNSFFVFILSACSGAIMKKKS